MAEEIKTLGRALTVELSVEGARTCCRTETHIKAELASSGFSADIALSIREATPALPEQYKHILLRHILIQFPEAVELNIKGIDFERDHSSLTVIATYISKNLHLQTIRINDCNIGDSGFEILARGLEQHSLIWRLELDGNKLTDASANKLFDMLNQRKPVIIDAKLNRDNNDVSRANLVKIDQNEHLNAVRIARAIRARQKAGSKIEPGLAKLIQDAGAHGFRSLSYALERRNTKGVPHRFG